MQQIGQQRQVGHVGRLKAVPASSTIRRCTVEGGKTGKQWYLGMKAHGGWIEDQDHLQSAVGIRFFWLTHKFAIAIQSALTEHKTWWSTQ